MVYWYHGIFEMVLYFRAFPNTVHPYTKVRQVTYQFTSVYGSRIGSRGICTLQKAAF